RGGLRAAGERCGTAGSGLLTAGLRAGGVVLANPKDPVGAAPQLAHVGIHPRQAPIGVGDGAGHALVGVALAFCSGYVGVALALDADSVGVALALRSGHVGVALALDADSVGVALALDGRYVGI